MDWWNSTGSPHQPTCVPPLVWLSVSSNNSPTPSECSSPSRWNPFVLFSSGCPLLFLYWTRSHSSTHSVSQTHPPITTRSLVTAQQEKVPPSPLQWVHLNTKWITCISRRTKLNVITLNVHYGFKTKSSFTQHETKIWDRPICVDMVVVLRKNRRIVKKKNISEPVRLCKTPTLITSYGEHHPNC